jgi:hypothetical protein
MERLTEECKANVMIGNAMIEDMVRIFLLIFETCINDPLFSFDFALGTIS